MDPVVRHGRWVDEAIPGVDDEGFLECLLLVDMCVREQAIRCQSVVDDAQPFRFDESGRVLPVWVVFVLDDTFAPKAPDQRSGF